MKALLIASLAAVLLATPAGAQSFDLARSFERAVERVTNAGERAVRRVEIGVAQVERRHDTCEDRASGSGTQYIDCFVVQPVASSEAAATVRSWSNTAWRRLSSL